MDKNTVLLVIAVGLAGFIGGFLLANGLNRSEMTQGQVGQSTGTSNSATQTLSPEEIRAKVEEADRNAGDFAFQKNLGIALYKYSANAQDLNALVESERILARAAELDPKDFETLVAHGHASFDIGYAKRQVSSFEKARELYQKALAIRPTDLDVKTDLGISYLVQEPPELAKAASELEAVGKADPRHDRSMQFLARVYVRQMKLTEAEKLVAKIREINPSNPAIAEITSEISSARAGSR